jgi:hypothetical protein
MNTVTGKYRKGRISLDQKVEWSENDHVEVTRVKQRIDMTEAEWPTTPEGLAALFAEVDAFEPVVMTPEEEAEWHAALRESDLASMDDVRKRLGWSQ